MNFSSLRTVTAIALTALLTACGAGQQDNPASTQLASMQLASTVHSTAAVTVGGSAGANVAAIPAPGPNSPAPDCAAEGCASLRIIDGNAEAYRLDAMRRAAAENGTQS